jgi:DNA end-binding protein Ku
VRALWTATLKLRRLEIPVGLASARREQRIGLRLLHRGCKTPVSQMPWCAKHERPVPAQELQRGFEVAPGKFLALSDKELASLDDGQASNLISVSCFVPDEAIYPASRLGVYYLLPSKLPVGARQYVALQEALAESGLAGICRLHWRSEWVAAIAALPDTRALTLTRLAPSDEVIDANPLERDLLGSWPRPEDVADARALIKRMTKKRIPAAATRMIEEQETLRELIDRKIEQHGPLTNRLQRSLQEARTGQQPNLQVRHVHQDAP